MEKKKNFIVTDNENSKNELLKMGLNLIQSDDEHYVFLNCSKMNFSNVKDYVFTDKLCI